MILRSECLPSQFSSFTVGAQGVAGTTQFVGSDGQLHALPSAATCPQILACITVPLFANDGITLLGHIAP